MGLTLALTPRMLTTRSRVLKAEECLDFQQGLEKRQRQRSARVQQEAHKGQMVAMT